MMNGVMKKMVTGMMKLMIGLGMMLIGLFQIGKILIGAPIG